MPRSPAESGGSGGGAQIHYNPGVAFQLLPPTYILKSIIGNSGVKITGFQSPIAVITDIYILYLRDVIGGATGKHGPVLDIAVAVGDAVVAGDIIAAGNRVAGGPIRGGTHIRSGGRPDIHRDRAVGSGIGGPGNIGKVFIQPGVVDLGGYPTHIIYSKRIGQGGAGVIPIDHFDIPHPDITADIKFAIDLGRVYHGGRSGAYLPSAVIQNLDAAGTKTRPGYGHIHRRVDAVHFVRSDRVDAGCGFD